MRKLLNLLGDVFFIFQILIIFYFICSSIFYPLPYNLNLNWYRLAFITPTLAVIFVFIINNIVFRFLKIDNDDKDIKFMLLFGTFFFSIVVFIINSFFCFNNYYIAAKLYNIESVKPKINYYQKNLNVVCSQKNRYSASCSELNNYIYSLDKNTLGENLYHEIQLTDNLAECFSENQKSQESYYKIFVDKLYNLF